jgi:hypothetical protein
MTTNLDVTFMKKKYDGSSSAFCGSSNDYLDWSLHSTRE